MENFESGTASGWRNNLVTNGGATFTSFLGQFGGTGGNQTIFKEKFPSGLFTLQSKKTKFNLTGGFLFNTTPSIR